MGLRLLQQREMSGGEAVGHPEWMKTQCVWPEETPVDPQAKAIRRTGRAASNITRRRQRGRPEAVLCGWALFRSQSKSFSLLCGTQPFFKYTDGKLPHMIS